MKINGDLVLSGSNHSLDYTHNIANNAYKQYNRATFYYGTNTISVTPTYDSIIDITYTKSGWGYGGGDSIVSISCTKGNATKIFGGDCKITGADLVARSMTARYLFKLKAKVTYTFLANVSNTGSTQSQYMVGVLYESFGNFYS